MQKGPRKPGRRTEEEVDADLGKVISKAVKTSEGARKWVRRLSIPVLFDIALTLGGIGLVVTVKHVQADVCHRVNSANGRQLKLWSKLLQAPRAPLSPTATAAERKAYDEATRARDDFGRDLHSTFDPIEC